MKHLALILAFIPCIICLIGSVVLVALDKDPIAAAVFSIFGLFLRPSISVNSNDPDL